MRDASHNVWDALCLFLRGQKTFKTRKRNQELWSVDHCEGVYLRFLITLGGGIRWVRVVRRVALICFEAFVHFPATRPQVATGPLPANAQTLQKNDAQHVAQRRPTVVALRIPPQKVITNANIPLHKCLRSGTPEIHIATTQFICDWSNSLFIRARVFQAKTMKKRSEQVCKKYGESSTNLDFGQPGTTAHSRLQPSAQRCHFVKNSGA